MQHSLAVVILHYGAATLTTRLHAQLRTSDPSWNALFVVDNNAPEPYPNPWIRFSENRYWPGALHAVSRRLRDEGFSHVWFLNNDVSFVSKPPVISTAWLRLQRLEKTLGAVGVYSPSVLTNPYHPQMVHDPQHQYRRTRYVDGIAPLFNLACLHDIGGVDHTGNDYGYGVDVALSLAASNAGWPVVVDHQVCLKHAYHSTAKTIDGFLEKAALAEADYMQRVLGPDWREIVDHAKKDFSDHSTM